jgi:hypothetical protein
MIIGDADVRIDAKSHMTVLGEKHSRHLTAVFIMLEKFLTDELTLAVAVGGEPNSPGGA